MPSRSVAVIDIGSNSIKLLLAARGPGGELETLKVRTIDGRISAGISKAVPRLSDEGIARAVEAVRALLGDVQSAAPSQTIVVATSAVRDAENGNILQERVRALTGHEVRVLSGHEEANLIGRGLTADPALHDLRDFYVFDLGGGSLECLSFRGRRVDQAVSLPLGCVRLTERFVADAALPISDQALDAVRSHTRDVLDRSGFVFSLPAHATAIGTGGTVTTVRAILGARDGRPFPATDPVVTVPQLRALLAGIAALPLDQRQQIPGLPAARADIFPVALATLIAVADAAKLGAFRNSVHNLRYGLADEAL